MKIPGTILPRLSLISSALVFFVTLFSVGSVSAQPAPAERRILVLPGQVRWSPAKVLPRGAEVAVLEGDPDKAGFFTMRLRMPDGYRVPAHSHSQRERIVVLKGMLNLGMGGKFDPAKTDALTPGTYSSMPPGMNHFAWVKGETILQLSSIGPWTVAYVNPQEDPRLVKSDPGGVSQARNP